MDGTSLTPLIIFKGKTLSSRWIPTDTPSDWFFFCNNEGWTSNEHAKKWLMEDFEPNTEEKAQGRTHLLIFDGHGSHTTPDAIRHCIFNRIKLALLPPHSSHLTQPLDVGVFSSMKAHMTRELDRYIRTGILRIQKIKWLEAFTTSRSQAFTIRNILSGWSGTGLYPFNPGKVLRRVPILASNEPPIRLPTPPSHTPLENPDLNSSPLESSAMNAANTHIKHRARNRTADFDTPVRKHVIRMATALNRSLAKNRVQAAQLSDLQRLVTTRKQRQSGKHNVLRAKLLLQLRRCCSNLKMVNQARKHESPANKISRLQQPRSHQTSIHRSVWIARIQKVRRIFWIALL
jgi:hypothetical protein